MKRIYHYLKREVLKVIVTFLLLLYNDLLILNAALTYYALLSFAPLLLIMGVVSQKVIILFPEFPNFVTELLKDLNIEGLAQTDITTTILKVKSLKFGIFGLLSLLLTSTLFLRSLNKVFRKIFKIKNLKEYLFHNLIPLLLYMVFIFLTVMALIIKALLGLVEKFIVDYLSLCVL